jgi:hypothetical protein
MGAKRNKAFWWGEIKKQELLGRPNVDGRVTLK